MRPRGLRLWVGAAGLFVACAAADLGWLAAAGPRGAAAADAALLAAVEARHQATLAALQRSLDDLAASPDLAAVARREPAPRAQAFRRLARLRIAEQSLAIRDSELDAVAWAGPATDAPRLRPLTAGGATIGVVSSGGAARYVALRRVGDAWLSAEAEVAVRRNIRNAFVQDAERLADREGRVALRFVHVDEPPPPVDPSERALAAPDGRLLAVARTRDAEPGEWLARRARVWLALLAVAAAALVVSLSLRAGTSVGMRALAVVAARVVLLPASSALPFGALASAEQYASPALGPLLRSPLDLGLTAAAAVALAALAAAAALARAGLPAPTATLAAAVAAPAGLACAAALVADIAWSSAAPPESLALLPTLSARSLLQLSAGLLWLAGLTAATAALASARELPVRRLLAAFALGSLVGHLLLVRFELAPPWPIAALLAALALGLGLRAPALGRAWRAASPESRAAALALLAPLAGLLAQPTLAAHGDAVLRREIEADFAPRVSELSRWRAHVLARALERIDGLRLLAPGSESERGPIEELAFATWSSTDLAALGLSSAVEIQDPDGFVASRFALNLAPLAGPLAPLPRGEEWEQRPERIAIGSVERPVLHARRQLVYDGVLRGAVHVWVAEDYSNLPFLSPRDPYATLFRSAPAIPAREREVGLLALDDARRLQFSSADPPPDPGPDALARADAEPSGSWLRFPLDGRPVAAWAFKPGGGASFLYREEPALIGSLADAFEAAAAFSLAAAAALFAVLLLRQVLGRRHLTLSSVVLAVASRFSRRLFVALIALAVGPALLLQGVVRELVEERLARETEDQALERASIARKAVEDFAFFQRGDYPDSQPVTDQALVWVERLIRNDLDVFAQGRLIASSKRELYASGLLDARVDGETYRRLVLEGAPAVLRTERIGTFTFSVVSVPLALGGGEPGILSLPLASRRREVDAVLADLDRTARLASVAFLLLAAGLAFSMSRRISGPLFALTAATRRVARGDLGARVEPTTRDELRELVEAFNQMASELVRQRNDLERSNRLAAWAEMARQVAHEVKNPLTPIQLASEHLRRVYADRREDFGATLETCTTTILRQVATLRAMVTEFSSFARPPELRALDLQDVIAEAAAPYGSALPPGVSLVVEPGAGPLVQGDRRLLVRALVNLIENALSAVAEGGRMQVRALAEDGRAVLEVVDDGPGVPAEVASRAFEPYFSTRSGGTGLGLALVQRIAEAHGGGALLTPALPRGTRVRLWLPLATAAAEDAEPV
ncbi:MAG: ATP-binding protein [Vicinamibacteria bacterium]|nr:ATP-binding protein [Vicinamibacteria bacterium]